MRHPDGVLDDVALRVGRSLLAGGGFEEQDLDSLIAQATIGSPDEMLEGSRRIFRDVVEPLADRFDPSKSQQYVSFFSLLLSRLHGRPEFQRFHDRLAQSFDPAATATAWPDDVRHCVVLSRVTLGADVAVTSVVLAGLKRAYPDAKLTLACGEKVAELYRDDDQIAILPIEYARRGTLLDRLNAWVDLSERIEQLLGPDLRNSLVISPDSRLTQLGLLPGAPAGGHSISFDSRSYGSGGSESISELTSQWVKDMFDVEGARPFVALSESDILRGRKLRGENTRPMATLNWGFGGNDTKRVSTEFETTVVLELLRRGWRVVLDKGFGAEESAASEATEQAAADAGLGSLQLYEGPLSGFAGAIAASDLFVGYDSAAGHIAAAMGVPGIDVFRGAVCERMRQRWSPWGEKPAQVIDVPDHETPHQTLTRVLELLP